MTDYPPTLPKTGIWDIIFFRLSGTLSSAGSALTSYLLLAQLFPLRLIASRAHQLIASRAHISSLPLGLDIIFCRLSGTLSSAGSALTSYLLLAQPLPLRLSASRAHQLIASQAHQLIAPRAHQLIASRAHQLTPLAGSSAHASGLSSYRLSGPAAIASRCCLSGSAIASRAPQLSPLELISYRHSGSAAITSRAHQLLPLGRRS